MWAELSRAWVMAVIQFNYLINIFRNVIVIWLCYSHLLWICHYIRVYNIHILHMLLLILLSLVLLICSNIYCIHIIQLLYTTTCIRIPIYRYLYMTIPVYYNCITESKVWYYTDNVHIPLHLTCIHSSL